MSQKTASWKEGILLLAMTKIKNKKTRKYVS